MGNGNHRVTLTREELAKLRRWRECGRGPGPIYWDPLIAMAGRCAEAEKEARALERFRDHRHRHNAEMERRTVECAQLQDERDEARANLRKYGRHLNTCFLNPYSKTLVGAECTCGRDAALED